MPRSARVALAVVTALGGASSAFADCPTNTRELPPVGFLAEETRVVTAQMNGIVLDAQPRLVAMAAAAGGMRADDTEVNGTGSLGGQVQLRRGSFSGCASGDVLDVREGAAHGTASAQFPFFFTGISLGASFDRHVRLPLSTRADLFRAPVSRVATQLSISFIDFEALDRQSKLRVLIMPVAVEQQLTSQEDGALLDRRISTAEVAMFRFVMSDATSTGELSLFDMSFQEVFRRDQPTSTDPNVQPTPLAGFARIAPLTLSGQGEHWGFELDGGALSLEGDVDCDLRHCTRGYYLGSLRHAWRNVALEGRAERSGFLATNNAPAFEDRATLSSTVQDDRRAGTAAVFIARTQAWDTPENGRTVGVRVTFSHQLKGGLAALLDGELVRAAGSIPRAITQPVTGDAARVLVSVAWKKSMIRY